uniref:Uncharacterized protein n=1 Tax=Arundo donax TaxID=35708 RepID=A0A0A9ACT7_ARUDO
MNLAVLLHRVFLSLAPATILLLLGSRRPGPIRVMREAPQIRES